MKIAPLLISALLASIVVRADVTKAQLLGHWRYSDDKQSSEYVFHDDGTYSSNVGQHGKIVWELEGVWSLVDDTIYYTLTKSSLERIPVGTKDQDKIIEITRSYFVIETTRGGRRKYVRVRQ